MPHRRPASAPRTKQPLVGPRESEEGGQQKLTTGPTLTATVVLHLTAIIDIHEEHASIKVPSHTVHFAYLETLSYTITVCLVFN